MNFISYKELEKEVVIEIAEKIFPIRNDFEKLWEQMKSNMVDMYKDEGNAEELINKIFNNSAEAIAFDLCQSMFWCNEIMTDVVLKKTINAFEENKAMKKIIEGGV